MSQKNLDGSASAAVYSQKQLALVRKVRDTKNFYELLNEAREANEMEIKKAYKQLAFQLHPDKNVAPGADEAFKKVGNAVDVLLNKDKRKKYNNDIDFDDPNDSKSNPTSFLQSERYQQLMQLIGDADVSSLSSRWWISLMTVSAPIYSMNKATNYPVFRITQNLGVLYYVKNTFAWKFKGSLSQLENTIEDKYLQTRRYGRHVYFYN